MMLRALKRGRTATINSSEKGRYIYDTEGKTQVFSENI